MSTKMKVVLATAAILSAALGASAKDKGPPKINIEKTCQANTDALGTTLGGEIRATFDSCVETEKMALEEIIKNWAAYPAAAKTLCVQPNAYLPGYVEWLVCLDMTRDVIKKRAEPSDAKASDAKAEDPSSAATVGSSPKGRASNRRTPTERKECPIVKTNQDGSLAWVDACPLGSLH